MQTVQQHATQKPAACIQTVSFIGTRYCRGNKSLRRELTSSMARELVYPCSDDRIQIHCASWAGMGREEESRSQVDQFILDEIDSVPHLEALLLVWRRRPKQWSVEDMARELYVQPERAAKILQDLVNRSLISASQEANPVFFIDHSKPSERDQLLEAVDRIYRAEVVRVSTMIHAKASPAVRDFARAFRFKKERD